MMTTHTYAVLPVSQRTYDEIHGKLVEAGWNPAHGTELDMHGLALAPEQLDEDDALLEHLVDGDREGWRPVSENPPDVAPVLVWKNLDGGFVMTPPTHWMPLSEPPGTRDDAS